MHVKKKNKSYILGIIIIIIGVIIGIIPIFINKEEKKVESSQIDDFLLSTSVLKTEEKESSNIDNNSNENNEVVGTKENNASGTNVVTNNYLMVLEIPKIELKKGIYPLESKLNTIERNVAIMDGSSLPDIENGNLVLAAHNGTGKIAFFNKLHKINLGDKAYIYYQGIKYIYEVDNIYDVEKDGDVEIKRDTSKNTLTLVTCKKNTDDKQLVVILYLLNKEEY